MYTLSLFHFTFSGVGKSSLVHLILKGSAIARPAQTVGCAVGVKHITYGSAGGSSNNIISDVQRNFFVELWDVSGHERYRTCRSIFYTQINGKCHVTISLLPAYYCPASMYPLEPLYCFFFSQVSIYCLKLEYVHMKPKF
jgi:hypothetical protein